MGLSHRLGTRRCSNCAHCRDSWMIHSMEMQLYICIAYSLLRGEAITVLLVFLFFDPLLFLLNIDWRSDSALPLWSHSRVTHFLPMTSFYFFIFDFCTEHRSIFKLKIKFEQKKASGANCALIYLCYSLNPILCVN